MKTFRVETESYYSVSKNAYDIQAESWEVANAIAEQQPHVMVVDVKEISEVQESTQKIEDDFSDMMPTAEEFWYDAQPETYEPSCYDGTYSEM